MSLGMNLGLGISLFKYGRLRGKGGSGGGSISYPGLIAAWSAKGKTNDDADRAILKDLTGNGHDITLNGFAFSEMSGYGGFDYPVKSKYIIRPKVSVMFGVIWIKQKIPANTSLPNFDIQVNGFIDGKLYVSYPVANYKKYLTNGLNHVIDIPVASDVGPMFIDLVDVTNFNQEIVVEFIPKYPDALVFDGVDDYGINEDMPIINDYTLIVKRQWVKPLDTERVLISNGDAVTGLYATELRRVNSFGTIINFGNSINVSDSYEKSGYYYNYDIIYQNANTYNGETKLSKGSNKTSLKYFMIGRFRPSEYSRYFKGAFYSAYLFDRSLDEQEIKSFIRKYIDPEYLLPSEIPTPDCYYDFSKGSNDDVNRNTIKDYSGNGNDAVAHNFAWSGMSGYGGNLYGNYKYHFDTLGKYQNIILDAPIIGNLKFKVTGLTDYFNKTTNFIELRLIRVSDGGADYKNIKEDGEYNIELPTSKYSTISIRSGGVNIEDGTCNIDIEMLPEYPGTLVFDGIDDYVSLDAFDSGFKTMFMVCKSFKSETILYDQRSVSSDYAIFNNINSVAYNARNGNPTYINGIRNNNVLTNELLNKKHLISIYTQNVNKSSVTIGTNKSKRNFANMALYKFLGFKEAITEEQIPAVIKKYNLLDGVDEIEVS